MTKKTTMTNNVYTTNNTNWATSALGTMGADSGRQEDQNLKVIGRLEVNDRDLLGELDELKDAVGLLKRCFNLEARYPKLKELAEEYNKQMEKYKTLERLR